MTPVHLEKLPPRKILRQDATMVAESGLGGSSDRRPRLWVPIPVSAVPQTSGPEKICSARALQRDAPTPTPSYPAPLGVRPKETLLA